MKRTEEQIVAQVPIVVILGGKEYKIAPLVIRDSIAWRRKVVPFLTKETKPDSYEAALNEMLITMPTTLLDLFFEYAKDLNRKEIEGIATEEEVAKAFNLIVEAYLPLSQSLPRTVKTLSR